MKTLQQRIESQIAEYRNRVTELELEIVRERKDKALASISEYDYHNRQIAVASRKITTLNQAIADFDLTLCLISPIKNNTGRSILTTALTTKQTTMSKHDEFPTKPDYEAKYKALEQAVKDAISEMDTVKDFENYDYRGGILAAISILHDKTGITA